MMISSSASASLCPEPSLALAVYALWKREVVRFLRQRSRVIGALGTPIVFWIVIGSGLGNSFRPPGSPEQGVHFLEYAFPGTLAMIILFTAIFSMISVIEDRKAGFLQAVIASPASRLSIVAGKVLGSTTLALGQAAIFLFLAPIAGVSLSAASVAGVFLMLTLVALGQSGLGFLIAWPMESTQGFHAIMNLGLMPMLFLSGALFPAAGASSWMGSLMAINPLTYGVSGIRRALYAHSSPMLTHEPPIALCIVVTVAFAAATIGVSTYMLRRIP
jgi:ABC-2 type transport system permease protein